MDADGSSAIRRSLAYPRLDTIAAFELSADGQLAAALSLDGVLSVLAAPKLAAASGCRQL